VDSESLKEARNIAEQVRYQMESYMPLSFSRNESSFQSPRPVKPYYLLIMLLYAMFRVLLAMAHAHAETNELSQALLERLIIANIKNEKR
jgi:hypothetical protein